MFCASIEEALSPPGCLLSKALTTQLRKESSFKNNNKKKKAHKPHPDLPVNTKKNDYQNKRQKTTHFKTNPLTRIPGL